MPKKRTKKHAAKFPTEPMLVGLGLAALLRDKTYEVISRALEQSNWLGKSQAQMEKTLRTRGEKEYARLVRDVERAFTTSMKRVKKTVKKK